MKTITSLILFFLTITTFAQNNNYKKAIKPKAIAEKINIASKNTKTIDSDFKQFKHLDILENDIVSSGHFSYKAKDKVRWEYLQPYNYLIVMNGNDMQIYDGTKIQKYDTESNKMFKEINDLMVGMLQGNILRSNKFDVNFYENKSEVKAVLIPKTPQMKNFLDQIELYFDKKNYSVKMIVMNEAQGDYTKMIFNKQKRNIEIPNSTFLIH